MGTPAGDQSLPMTSIEARTGNVVYEFLARGDTVRIVHPTGDTTLLRHLSPVAIDALRERLMAGVELRVVPTERQDSSTAGPMTPYVRGPTEGQASALTKALRELGVSDFDVALEPPDAPRGDGSPELRSD